MNRIKLNKNSKRILKALKYKAYPDNIPTDDYEDINLLKQDNLVETMDAETGAIILVQLTDFGRAYFQYNPKLKNPSIWEDKKYWITTSISIIALIISLIAIIK